MEDPLELLAEVLRQAGVDYAVIGGHAVNAWVEPRFTADIDVTIAASASDLGNIKIELERRDLSIAVEHGTEQASGPDFIRFTSNDSRIVFEFQVAKTRLQADIIRRAKQDSRGLRVASPEDLIILKLIANRPKDQIDLIQLCGLPYLDWDYILGCAAEWELTELLESFRNPSGA